MAEQIDVNSAENEAIIAELEQKANEVSLKEAAKAAIASKLFNPMELTKRAKQVLEGNSPVLGKIRYGELTLADSFTISECKTDADKTCMAAYLMLKKGYPAMPNYTPINISEWKKTMPMAEGAALLLFIRSTPAFLRVQSIPGLVRTETPRK